ncbi:MAG TPA: hypothetical protein VH139_12700 [Acidobacteriaceae bacterium]|nr:hypothetical protein [Acidobacteriaceae bacterium]
MKSLRIAWRLLWANRWLWLLLVLWPWGMAAILLVGGQHPAPEDVEAALEQQSIYGLALVAFAGGALLGNEQRSRRIVLVLSRAVSRRQYLGALWLTAFLPLVLYVLDLALTGPVVGAPAFLLWQTLGALLLLSLTAASLAVLASLALPGVVAGVLSLTALSLPLLLPPGWQIAQGRLLQILLSGPTTEHAGLIFGAGLLEGVVLCGAIFEAAVRIFERRDLRLKSE